MSSTEVVEHAKEWDALYATAHCVCIIIIYFGQKFQNKLFKAKQNSSKIGTPKMADYMISNSCCFVLYIVKFSTWLNKIFTYDFRFIVAWVHWPLQTHYIMWMLIILAGGCVSDSYHQED